MIGKIVIEIRHNKTNNQCTDGETDCLQLGYNHKEQACWCELFRCSIEDGPSELCIKRRKEVRDLFEQIEKAEIAEKVTYARGAIRRVKDLLLNVLRTRPYAIEENKAICAKCGQDDTWHKGTDRVCVNCDDTYHLFREKKDES